MLDAIWRRVSFLLLSPASLTGIFSLVSLGGCICGFLPSIYTVSCILLFPFESGKTEAQPEESARPSSNNTSARREV